MLQALLRALGRRAVRAEDDGDEAAELEAIAATEERAFPYDVLAAATGNFSDELRGNGSGQVFKGRLGDGREVAVSRLAKAAWRRRRPGHGDAAAEFVRAATAMSRVQHRNVAALHGYCIHGDDVFLVHEHLPSLDKSIFHAERAGRCELDWSCRYDIVVGLARGMLYLHEGANIPVVHGRINAGAVLLKDRRVPKIAGLGAASLAAAEEPSTRVDERVDGVDSHMAPEYAMHGYLSPKADVYSFGVVVLEIISGRDSAYPAAVDGAGGHGLLDWAWRLHRSGKILEIMDAEIASTVDSDQVELCAHLALLCVQANPMLRPDMKRVVVGLSKKHSALEEPTRPGILGVRYRRRALRPQHHRHSEEAT